MKPALTRDEIKWAYEKWCERYNLDEIANALYVNKATLRKYMHMEGYHERNPKALEYDFEKEKE